MTGFATAAHFADVRSGTQAVLSLTTGRGRLHRLVKWRNQLLALFCLLAFAGLGILYFQHWVVQKPFGIILFIGEGLSPSRLAATRVYAGGADSHLSLDSMTSAALLTNYSNDFAAPDQAAAATALATGVKTNNRAIGLDPKGKIVRNIIELAHDSGRACGLVTNTKLTDATAAAFYAHCSDGNDRENVALEFLKENRLDIALGGGGADFFPITKQGNRHDDRDLLLEMRRNGYDIVRSKVELEAVPRWRRPKLFGVFSAAEFSYAGQVATGREQPGLADMVSRAIELLQFNPKGYLLVVDAGLMRKAAQENNGERTLSETIELDRALALARSYAGNKSMILLTGDSAIGGFTLNGYPFRRDSGVAILGFNSSGYPWLSWATGPHGLKRYGAPDAPGSPEQDPHNPQQPTTASEPAAIYSQSASNTVEDMVLFGTGPGTQDIRGIMDNTNVFRIIRDNL
jgi:alkaline phosphatase